MMKKIFVTLFIAVLVSCNSGEIFYLDSTNGSDDNPGTSPDKAWESLSRANKQEYNPGDKILFKAGERFAGQFEPRGSGNAKNPIIVDMYGKGAKPHLAGEGRKQHTILLEGIQYWEVNNLEITNLGETSDPGRHGVIIYAWDVGDVHHMHLKNLTVRDVNGSCIKNEGGGGGIYWTCGGDLIPTRYIDLLIEGCHVYNCQRNGITGNGNSNRTKWFPSLNVVIRNNLIERVPGDGIVPIACDGALVEWNIVRDSPDLLRIEDAAAGIWPWGSDNTLIRYNEVSSQNAKWDAQGFDSDYNCFNTTIEYNFSHDNAGGFVMVCNEGNTLGEPHNMGTVGTAIRNNVSINDGLRGYPTRPGWFSPTIHISGPAQNTVIENNTIVIFKKPLPGIDRKILVIDNWGGPWPENTLFSDNLFYVMDDELTYDFVMGNGASTQFEGNSYLGNFTNKPEPGGLLDVRPDLTESFPFPDGFPKELRARVKARMAQWTADDKKQ